MILLIKLICDGSVRNLQTPVPAYAQKENSPRQATISELFTSILPDLQVVDTWRYQRQVSGSVQEYMEAVSFQHYLETQTLITYRDAQEMVPRGIILTEDDYVLGVFDLSGELMRFAVTSMATNGVLPRGQEGGSEGRDILTDLRDLRMAFESLYSAESGKMFKKEMEKKMEVMKSSVEKVEKAMYGMIIRGRERPKGWMPEFGNEERGSEPVESY